MARHRKPSTAGQNAVRAVTAGVAAAAVPVVAPSPAFAFTPTDAQLNVIAQCESGNRNIPERTGSSTASGYFQIINGTWRANGGEKYASRAIGATRDQQLEVARNIAERRGSFADWNPSKRCWGPKIGNASAGDAPRATRRDTSASTPKTAPSGGRAADGTGSYVCTTDKLYFEACDPDTLGQVVQYPRYKNARTLRATETSVAADDVHVVRSGDTLAKIAAANGTSVRELHAANRNVIGSNPNVIHPGQRLRV